MEAGPDRRFLKQLAAKRELVIVVETCLFMSVAGKTFVGLNLLRHLNHLLCSTAQIKKQIIILQANELANSLDLCKRKTKL